ncbi:MAG: FAD:protein FMN transferase [Dehalococcoidia bacterium]
MAEFRAMGTDWRIEATGLDAAGYEAVRALVEHEEQRFSRFRADSALSRLNHDRYLTDTEIAALVRLALRLREATGGAFDPGVGTAVIEAGYDRSFERLAAKTSCARSVPKTHATATVRGGTIRLGRGGRLDLGGIAKGWTVDRVGRYLQSRGASTFLIDAGGDVLIGGPEATHTPQLVQVNGTPWMLRIEVGAVATSSTLRRVWDTDRGRMHHIVDPHSAEPARRAYAWATVVAPRAALADALATALLANPEAALAALPTFEAEAFLMGHDGTPQMTPGMTKWLAA